MPPKVIKTTPRPKRVKELHSKSPKSPRGSSSHAVDAQVLFLWTCLQSSAAMKEDGNFSIDFGGVAEKLGIQKGAASKRFSRLRISMKNKDPKEEASPKKSQDLDDSETPSVQNEQTPDDHNDPWSIEDTAF